jgi:hypothetical protein
LNNARRSTQPPTPTLTPSQQQMLEEMQKLQGERQYLAFINLQQSEQI